MQIRAKQQQTKAKCNEKTNEINKINEKLKHAKREPTQLTKKLDIEKENNVKLNKSLKTKIMNQKNKLPHLKQ